MTKEQNIEILYKNIELLEIEIESSKKILTALYNNVIDKHSLASNKIDELITILEQDIKKYKSEAEQYQKQIFEIRNFK